MKIKFYCPKCHDTCDYMCNKTTTILAQPVSVSGAKVNPESIHSTDHGGAICLLCGSILSHNVASYMISVKIYDDHEYVNGEDIINIHKRE